MSEKMTASEHAFTLADLEIARAERERLGRAYENYRGNNPNKYRSDIRRAEDRVSEIENALKKSGQLPVNEEERIVFALDEAFPNAKSREIVEFGGKKYQRFFIPLIRKSEKVAKWEKEWREVK